MPRSSQGWRPTSEKIQPCSIVTMASGAARMMPRSIHLLLNMRRPVYGQEHHERPGDEDHKRDEAHFQIEEIMNEERRVFVLRNVVKPVTCALGSP